MPTKDQIWEAVEALAQSLGVAAEYVWEVVGNQVVIEGTIWTSIGAASLIMGVILLFKGISIKSGSGRYSMDGEGLMGFGGGIILGGVICIGVALPMILNPGYAAIRRIAGLF